MGTDDSATIENRARALLSTRKQGPQLPRRFLSQMAHLTCPAQVWRYVEGAVTRSPADLVMLDLEDSIPQGDTEALRRGRDNIVRALRELDWGRRLRFFRPRGLELDPNFSDLIKVIEGAGDRLEGLVYPKVDGPEEVALLDEVLSEAEERAGLNPGHVRVELLIESVEAEARIEEIAKATPRLAGLVLGAFDYWSSLGLPPDSYRPDHPMMTDLRCRLVKAATHAGVPAIAEMTLNYPTHDKSEVERAAALEECRRDATLARDFGFAGKWVGIPAQAEVVIEVFRPTSGEIRDAIAQVRAFREAVSSGRGATMIDGRMADRATDRLNRSLLERARTLGLLDPITTDELGIGTLPVV